MSHTSKVLEQRRSSRVQLNLPVRLRWQSALHQTIEVSESLDVSRTGLLFYRTQAMPVNSRLWVMHPYSPEGAGGQPETPARVVRVKTTPGGGQLVAVEFEFPRRSAASAGKFNRRKNDRTSLALPLTVRRENIPWPEEFMTQDVSPSGVAFCTAQQYAMGEEVRVRVAYGPWAAAGELRARVVRLQPVTDSVEQRVSLAFLTN